MDAVTARQKISADESLILKELYDRLPFSLLGESIAAFIYIQVIFIIVHKIPVYWILIELSAILIQLSVIFSFQFYPIKQINYKWAYTLSVFTSFVSLGLLSIFYTYDNIVLEICLGIVYVAITTGGALFHCYIKYIHISQILILFIPYTLMTLFDYSLSRYIALGSLMYMGTLVFASNTIYNYMRGIFNLLKSKEISLNKLAHYKKELAEHINLLEIERNKLKALETQRMQINDTLITISSAFNHQNLFHEKLNGYIYQRINCMVIQTDSSGRIVSTNLSFLEYFNINNQDDLLHVKTRFLEKFQNGVVIKPYFPFTSFSLGDHPLILHSKDGKTFECSLVLCITTNLKRNFWILRDVTEILDSERNLFEMNYIDPNTTIFNKQHLAYHFNKIKQDADLNNTLVALVYMDINGFKTINDTQGHQIGDQLLKLFAHRLDDLLGKLHYVCRVGGDEFVCVISHLDYKQDIAPFITQIKQTLESEYRINNSKYFISTSIGVSFYPCDAHKLEDLLRYADLAMYQTKENKLISYQKYNPNYLLHLSEIQKITTLIKNSVAERSFFFLFQPIYDLENHKIVKIEVLLRLKDGLSPKIFIPIAERLGLIEELGFWTIHEACKIREKLVNILDPEVKFCINISQYQLSHNKNIDTILDIINKTNCSPNSLELEFNEAILSQPEIAKRCFKILNQRGIQISIDDFGSGYSSLSHLKSLQIDNIKVDREFIENSGTNKNADTLFKAIIQLANHLNFKIIVKSIEKIEELKYCKSLNCHFGQGYIFSKPMLLNDLIQLIHLSNPPHSSSFLTDKSVMMHDNDLLNEE